MFMKGIKMKLYTIGLITGILLTASTFMFIGATTNQDHTHDATDIKYQSFEYGAYGTLQKKVKELDSDIDNKANSSHTHNSYEIIGIEDHSHYDYALSFHTHY